MPNPEAERPHPLKPPPRWPRIVGLLLGVCAVFASAWHIGVDFRLLGRGSGHMWRLLTQFFAPNWSYIEKIMPAIFETLRMAVLGTTLGAIISIPIIFGAARNVTQNRIVRTASRAVLNVLRTIPELLFAAIFVAIVGLGATAGVMAITFFSFGIIAKLTSEAVETIDPGPMEALTAAGASRPVLVGYAVVPQILPHFISYVLYTFEINVRAATVLGLVGAGGIGVPLNTALRLLQYDKVASILIVIFAVVLVIDGLSQTLRRRLQ
ncbi:MAG: phosphonate ABC transporter, permease protein PhnE [Hydrogenibacillus sp.]|nr:phosphonate ABC transporter, permease protein PhnE [Hydrogenibacillus sp.]